MSGIAWNLLQPVDTGAQSMQGFQTGMALVKGIQTKSALGAYLANPDDPQAFGALAYLDPQAAHGAQQQHMMRQKMLAQQAAQERAQQLGSLAVDDPHAAREEAMRGGDFDLADTFGKLGDEDRKRTAEFWEKAGPVAWQLKQERDPAKRMALWQQAKPILAATAGNAALLEQFDPTNDAQLEAAIATSQKVGDLITQSRVTWQPQGEAGSIAFDYWGRPVGNANPAAGGTIPAATGAAPTAVASTLASAMPPHVVAGFLGNFEVEGGYGGAKGDGGTAAGIAQWRGERQTNFQRVVGKPVEQASPEEQARFVLWEMQNPQAAGMTVEQRDAILNAPDAATAAALIDEHYERSDDKHRQKRVEAATRYAGGGPARVASREQYAQLASGTEYIAPDGSVRRKP